MTIGTTSAIGGLILLACFYIDEVILSERRNKKRIDKIVKQDNGCNRPRDNTKQ